MFSVNPGYDYQKGDYANGTVDERAAVYRRCEVEGNQHLGDEALFRRAAAGCFYFTLWKGPDGGTSACGIPWIAPAFLTVLPE